MDTNWINETIYTKVSNMNITKFMAFLKANKIKHQKCGDDICVDHTIYQFGYGGDLIGIVLSHNHDRR